MRQADLQKELGKIPESPLILSAIKNLTQPHIDVTLESGHNSLKIFIGFVTTNGYSMGAVTMNVRSALSGEEKRNWIGHRSQPFKEGVMRYCFEIKVFQPGENYDIEVFLFDRHNTELNVGVIIKDILAIETMELIMSERESIKSGDMLIWAKSAQSNVSNFYLNVIRLMTRSEYAHIAIAWRLEGRLYVVEATQPVVRISPVKDDQEFYHIPMNVKWDKNSEEYLIDKIGCVYSLMDGIRAYLGKTVENDRDYQCAELANEFYSQHGIHLGEAYTPALLVERALMTTGCSLSLMSSIKTA